METHGTLAICTQEGGENGSITRLSKTLSAGNSLHGHCVIHSIKRKTEQPQNIPDSRVFFAMFPEGEDPPWISFAPSSVSGEVLCIQQTLHKSPTLRCLGKFPAAKSLSDSETRWSELGGTKSFEQGNCARILSLVEWNSYVWSYSAREFPKALCYKENFKKHYSELL